MGRYIMYYGYEWEKQLTKLASRLTILAGKEIHLNTFDGITVTVNGKECGLRSITYCSTFIEESLIKEAIADLDCIYWNKRDNISKVERHFIVAHSPEVVQAWYKMMYDGSISLQVLRHFGEDRLYSASSEEIEAVRESIKTKAPAMHTV